MDEYDIYDVWYAFGDKRPARETVGESSCMRITIIFTIFTMVVKSIAVSEMEALFATGISWAVECPSVYWLFREGFFFCAKCVVILTRLSISKVCECSPFGWNKGAPFCLGQHLLYATCCGVTGVERLCSVHFVLKQSAGGIGAPSDCVELVLF